MSCACTAACSCGTADVSVIVTGRAERRARRLHHIAQMLAGVRAGLPVHKALQRADDISRQRVSEMLAGLRAGLSAREALDRADEVAHQRERVLAEHERRGVS